MTKTVAKFLLKIIETLDIKHISQKKKLQWDKISM